MTLANSGRTLRADDEISRYRIVALLGAGGMGEVYLAEDQSLGRKVALKILPPHLTRSDERVRRFVLEARSASSLSHPNIVTIHEIGNDAIRSEGGADSGPVHFISMELVNGRTLSALIHEERAPLRVLVGLLAQAADGIAKAHAAGIVHRDLKPGNIMVTSDGFAKVLDFGLAKLTERSDADSDATRAATLVNDRTSEGAVVGTAGYMSPEQVRGKRVDHRSDTFSFGCILYEATTGQPAFAAESSVETMHKVLNDNPTPIEEINARVPAELRRLIRRCLDKDPNRRLQSMKDVALELREIEAEYDAFSASTGSGDAPANLAPAARKRPSRLLIAASVVVLAALAVTAWVLRRSTPSPDAFQKMRMTTLTSTGDVVDAALSLDGRYLAYVSERAGKTSLVVRQVATGSDVVIVQPGEARLEFPSFSVDGNYLYYAGPRPDRPPYRSLYQVASLGGRPSEVVFDVNSRATFSPDDKQLAFVRQNATGSVTRLIVFDRAARQERVLAEIASPADVAGSPSWSPDGRHIALLLRGTGPGLQATIALFDARNGHREDWKNLPLSVPTSVTWTETGVALATTGQSLEISNSLQLRLYAYPTGGSSRVTNDFFDYGSVSASSASQTLAAVRSSRTSTIFLADADGSSLRRLTTATGPENSFILPAPADTGTILCCSPKSGVLQIWAIGTSDGEARALTGTESISFRPMSAAGTVVFHRTDHTGIHVWAMDAEGGAQRQLTHDAWSEPSALSPDGKLVLVAAEKLGVYEVRSTTDGHVYFSADSVSGLAGFSPDSRFVIVAREEPDGQGLSRDRYEVRSVTDGAVTAVVRPPANATNLRWSPDGRAITYCDRGDPGWNVFRMPLDGRPAAAVTRVTDGRALQYEWSPDGRRLAIVVRAGERVDVVVTDVADRAPVRIPQIAPEVVRNIHWMPDSRRLVVEAATRTSDVVLIRDFR